ncbi:putative E3 ubiquitin-protein ligase XBAT35 [Citrus sinensis]|uniref:putative E3 ubiquitin-protein ligase XBAT34 isoform X4 n=1 Tax=Citrus sinensis TaxID=2711 RepID=UPI00219F39DE|nr:putative E3 ubiquitin-protein ligase XBAT34 isoform X4 [Citrus sinensis]KAH9764357.1 putative E3 ubiquitin-protein ligase XBAT35 [Citrus sinensis]
MGLQQSKEELLYQQVNYGNVEGIKALCRDGAGLEWIDKEGKTPLIVACMNPGLYDVAKTLIELGAKVDAYRPSRHGGTPLHHAAKRGLERTVKLLLSYGANALVLNDDCQTPLEVARAKGFTNVVRAIENHICIFSGWLRELYGPGFLELLAPQLLSRKVWVAVLPTGSRNPTKPFKLELAIYPSLLDARPRMVIALWKANLEEPKFQHSDPSVTIVDNSTKTRIKLAAANESDKQQLQAFCNACKGIPQSHAVQATAPTPAEDLELAMAINASIQTAIAETPICDPQPSSGATAASTSWNNSGQGASAAPSPSKASSSQWVMHEARLSGHSSQQTQIQNNNMPATKTMIHSLDTIPSAPPVTDEITEDGPVQYPSIDVGPVDVSSPSIEQLPCSKSKVKGDKDATSSCVICLDAPVEGACVPCGHMAGCMSCLNEVKAKKWGCPVCRANISQVIRLYAV